MKLSSKVTPLLIFVLVCAWVAGASTVARRAQSAKTQSLIEGKVVSVHDGDTITVLDKDNTQHKIRFMGIDAPESKQAFGQVSKENLSRLIFGKQVKVAWSKQDRYGRTVGKVLLDGQDINLEQIKAGLAWHYKQYANEQPPEDRITYAAAEREAREARRGLWQDPNPTPPGEWRAEARTERRGTEAPEGASTPKAVAAPASASTSAQASAPTANAAGPVIGNKNSKVYHRPDCPGYKSVSEKNQVRFNTAEEAEAAGYHAAKNCPAPK